jgi:hypothetical protein
MKVSISDSVPTLTRMVLGRPSGSPALTITPFFNIA